MSKEFQCIIFQYLIEDAISISDVIMQLDYNRICPGDRRVAGSNPETTDFLINSSEQIYTVLSGLLGDSRIFTKSLSHAAHHIWGLGKLCKFPQRGLERSLKQPPAISMNFKLRRKNLVLN